MIELIETDAGLFALAADWEALWQATPEATPFQSPRWLLPWWRQFGTGMPRVAVAREGGRLTGILPLYILPEQRKALPIGAGTTDYLDGLGRCAGLLEAVLDRLHRDPVDVCDLIDLPPCSPLAERIPQRWHAQLEDGESCPVLILPAVPARARRKLNMSRNRAQRAGSIELDVADAASLPVALDHLARLHQARWTAQDGGIFADHRMRDFLADAAGPLLEIGSLRLYRLLLAGETIAATAVLLASGRVLFYMSGFDATHAFISPGTLLIGAVLDQALAEGCAEIHFLRGREDYKYRWGAIDRLNRQLRLVPRR